MCTCGIQQLAKSVSAVMEGRSCLWRILLLSCSWLGAFQLACSQSTCNSSQGTIVITANSTTPHILMNCTVPPEQALSNVTDSTWQWNRLAADGTVDETLSTGPTTIIAGLEPSAIYQLSVNCSTGSFYQALYNNLSGSCLHTCSFFVEVEEVRDDVILDAFSSYLVNNGACTDRGQSMECGGGGYSAPYSQCTCTMVSLSNALSNESEPTSFVQGENGTEVLVGSCSTMFYSGLSGCLLHVQGQWFKDREISNVQNNPQYTVSVSGELRIVSLSESTIGEYACVTTLPRSLGDFVTLAVGVSLAPALATSTFPMTTDTQATPSPPVSGALRDWEIGLIAANLIVVVLLVGLVLMGFACFVARRRDRPQAKRTPVSVPKPRPQSMIEQIQLLEEAVHVEEVDFVNTGTVEVPFSSILFEELLHKGTFKVVHHAVINYPALGIMSLPVAVKRLKDDNSELGMEELMSEVYTLKAFQNKAGSHPNIVSLVGVTTEGGPTCLLLEYVPHGRLDDFLIALKDGPLPEWYVRFVKETNKRAYHKHVSGDLMRVLVQVAEGMNFLTDHGFIHRDLSTRTILIGDRMNIKIADTGMTHEGYYYVVTEREHFLQDMAPECLWEKRYSVWSDVWSFGILTYKVITMETVPFPDATVNDLYDKMVGGERPQQLASFSNELYFLLQRCWQFIATERPTFTNIVTDLKDMAEKPAKHIILKTAKEPQAGYISETGEVFLHPLPSYALDHPSKSTKKKWRSSGTRQSIVSSVNDTVYTRETAETVIDFSQSENEGNDDYESYLLGDLSTWKKDESSSSSDDGNLDTPRLRQTKGTRVWVESAGSKVYMDTPLASDDRSKSDSAGKKKKKKRSMKEGFVNPIAMMSTKSPEPSGDGEGGVGVNTNNSNNVGAWHEREESRSSDDSSSAGIEDETDGVARRLTSDQSASIRHSSQSSEEIEEL